MQETTTAAAVATHRRAKVHIAEKKHHSKGLVARFKAYLDVPLEVIGSMVIGSVGYNYPQGIPTIYKEVK